MRRKEGQYRKRGREEGKIALRVSAKATRNHYLFI